MDSKAKRYITGKTIFLYCGFAGFGLVNSLAGPSTPDLCERMGITAEQIAIAFSLTALFWTVGAIVFGPILDRFQSYSDVFLGLSITTMSLTTLIKPFSSELWIYCLASVIEALAYAGIDLSSNMSIFSLYGEDANSPVQGLHTAWGFGFAFGPLIIRPFLGPDIINTDFTTYAPNNSSYDSSTPPDGTAQPNEVSRIEIAYAIIGTYNLILAFVAFFMFFLGKPPSVLMHRKENVTFRSVFSPGELANGDKKFAVQILTLFALFYFGNAGREGIFNTWLFSYAVVSELDFTKQEAAILDAAAKFSFLGGRIIASLLAIRIKIQPMLMVEVVLVLIFIVCLGLLGTKEKVYLWIFACLSNAFASPIWPGGLAWTDRYIVVTGLVFTVMNIGAGISGLVFLYLTGWLFTNVNANAVMYVLFACAASMVLLLIIMQIVASKRGERFGKGNTKPNELSEKEFDIYTIDNCNSLTAITKL